jgi:hypothetical protein
LVVPDFDDPDQEAKDHGNLMDEGVAEVDREAADAVGGRDHTPADQEAEPLPSADRPIGAAAFSEAQKAEEVSELQKARSGPSKSTEANQGSDEQAGELLAEQTAEAKDSVT